MHCERHVTIVITFPRRGNDAKSQQRSVMMASISHSDDSLPGWGEPSSFDGTDHVNPPPYNTYRRVSLDASTVHLRPDGGQEGRREVWRYISRVRIPLLYFCQSVIYPIEADCHTSPPPEHGAICAGIVFRQALEAELSGDYDFALKIYKKLAEQHDTRYEQDSESQQSPRGSAEGASVAELVAWDMHRLECMRQLGQWEVGRFLWCFCSMCKFEEFHVFA